jgi:transposase
MQWPAGHAVRELDAILESLEWGDFEKGYDGVRGQPPIHPRHMAAAILYGIICGGSSNRRLEELQRYMEEARRWLEKGGQFNPRRLDGAGVVRP